MVELFSSYGEIKTQRHNILLSAGSRGINDSEMLFLIASDTLSVAERGYDPRNPGLWVQTASIAHKRPIRTLSAVWSRGSTFIFLIVRVQQKKKIPEQTLQYAGINVMEHSNMRQLVNPYTIIEMKKTRIIYKIILDVLYN